MIVRLISGVYGGRIIKSPNSATTHPMNERMRGSLFNIISTEIIDARVLDVFAGTGAVGLEALSRGAKSVTFIERDRLANKVLNENIQTLSAVLSTTVFCMGVSTWIDKNQGDLYDIILVDPPYNDLQLSTVSRLGGLLKPNGLMVLSYPGRGAVPTIDKVVVVDNRRYGNAALAFYRKDSGN